MSRRSLVLLPAVIAAIALPVAPALAAEGTSPASSAVSTTSDSAGDLPFTHLDLALLGAAGGLLGVAGYGMHRLTRAPGSAEPGAEVARWNG